MPPKLRPSEEEEEQRTNPPHVTRQRNLRNLERVYYKDLSNSEGSDDEQFRASTANPDRKRNVDRNVLSPEQLFQEGPDLSIIEVLSDIKLELTDDQISDLPPNFTMSSTGQEAKTSSSDKMVPPPRGASANPPPGNLPPKAPQLPQPNPVGPGGSAKPAYSGSKGGFFTDVPPKDTWNYPGSENDENQPRTGSECASMFNEVVSTAEYWRNKIAHNFELAKSPFTPELYETFKECRRPIKRAGLQLFYLAHMANNFGDASFLTSYSGMEKEILNCISVCDTYMQKNESIYGLAVAMRDKRKHRQDSAKKDSEAQATATASSSREPIPAPKTGFAPLPDNVQSIEESMREMSIDRFGINTPSVDNQNFFATQTSGTTPWIPSQESNVNPNFGGRPTSLATGATMGAQGNFGQRPQYGANFGNFQQNVPPQNPGFPPGQFNPDGNQGGNPQGPPPPGNNPMGPPDGHAIPQAPQQWQQHQQPYYRPSFQKDLKPSVLSHSAKMETYNNWKRQYRSYFIASSMPMCDAAVQQGTLMVNIDNTLNSYLNKHTTPYTVTYGPNDHVKLTSNNYWQASYMQLLDAYFEKSNPLHMRRGELFQRYPKHGQPLSDYAERFYEAVLNCDLEKITAYELAAQFLINALPISPLRTNLITRKHCPNYEQIIDEIKNYELAQTRFVPSHESKSTTNTVTFANSSDDSDIAPSVNAVSRPRKKSGVKTPGKPKGKRSPRQKPGKQKDGQYFGCYRCTDIAHYPADCPYIEKTCNKCNKKGHAAKCCPDRAPGPKGPKRVNKSNVAANKISAQDNSSSESLELPSLTV